MRSGVPDRKRPRESIATPAQRQRENAYMREALAPLRPAKHAPIQLPQMPLSQPPPTETENDSQTLRSNTQIYRPSFVNEDANLLNKPIASTKIHGDPRPIKDPEFQKKAVKTIARYLTDAGYGAITLQALRGLTYRTFQDIFKFLHHRIVPNYEYSKGKFEDEFAEVLKSLRYPLLDAVSPRSLFSIAAPHSYPAFLALLLWMVEQSKMADIIYERDGAPVLNTHKEEEQLTIELLFEDYAMASYYEFMNGIDDHSAVNQTLDDFYVRVKQRHMEEAERLNEVIAELEEQYKQLTRKGSKLEALERKQSVLNQDIKKYEIYLKRRRQRIDDYIVRNTKVKIETEKLTQELSESEYERDALAERMEANNISEAKSAALEKKQLQLEKEYNTLKSKTDEMQKQLWSLEMQTEKQRDTLESQVAEYNTLAASIGIVPSDAANANGQDLRLEFSGADHNAKQILSLDLKIRVMPILQKLERMYAEKLHTAKESTQSKQEELVIKQNHIEALKNAVTSLSEKVEQRTKEWEDKHKAVLDEFKKYNEDLERSEQKVKELRSIARSELIAKEQKVNELTIAIREATLKVNERVSEMNQTLYTLASDADTIREKYEKAAYELLEEVKRECKEMEEA